MPSLVDTTIAATFTALATGIGALPFVFVKEFPQTIARWAWAAAAGLMLSASTFNLIFPGVEDGGITPVAIGILLGTLLMAATSSWLDGREIEFQGLSGSGAKRIILVLVTLFIHSFPEGIAVGVAYGSGEVGLGLLMAVAIAIHNIPEGLAVGLPLRAGGIGGWQSVGWAIFSSVPQILAAIPAYLAVIAFRPLLPYAFGFAAGAMIFLVFSELMPESQPTEESRLPSALVGMGGFLLMMVLQNLLEF
ncbi:MAG: ZIP family metal transporter [Chloroflexi bacterium]|nr:MAG: ZIP family metal transporter [Chloroflexota bacterium]MBL1193875.1 ZIP family metal transporter [Chloroflexota bacterium]NOH11169.1 ZIP family metal transporter [Chloroflexota bacterium]